MGRIEKPVEEFPEIVRVSTRDRLRLMGAGGFLLAL